MALLVLGGAAAGPTGSAAIEALTATSPTPPVPLLDDDLLPVASAKPGSKGVQPVGLEYQLGDATLRSFRAAVGQGSAVRWAKRIVAEGKAQGVKGLLILEGIGAARRPHGAPPVAQMHGKIAAVQAEHVPSVSGDRRSDLLQASAMIRTLITEADRCDLPVTFLFVYTSGSVAHDAFILAGALAQVLRVQAPAQPPAYWRALAEVPPSSAMPILFQ